MARPASRAETCEQALNDRVAAKDPETIAVLIVEPIMGDTGHGPTGGVLRAIGAICWKHGVPRFADDLTVGLGRTGRPFACEHRNHATDILDRAKGIRSGHLPFAAPIATESMRAWFSGEGKQFEYAF